MAVLSPEVEERFEEAQQLMAKATPAERATFKVLDAYLHGTVTENTPTPIGAAETAPKAPLRGKQHDGQAVPKPSPKPRRVVASTNVDDDGRVIDIPRATTPAIMHCPEDDCDFTSSDYNEMVIHNETIHP